MLAGLFDVSEFWKKVKAIARGRKSQMIMNRTTPRFDPGKNLLGTGLAVLLAFSSAGFGAVLEDPVQFTGAWEQDGIDHSYRVTVRNADHASSSLPTAVYLRNLPIPRIGTDSDEAIIADFLDVGLIVIEVDCRDLTDDPEALPSALMGFNKNLVQRVVSLSQGAITPDENFLYWLPEGYRLARNVPFWNLERHGAHGTLERMVRTYNDDVVKKAGVTPIQSAEELAEPDGEPLDMDLHLDILYPSGEPVSRPPVIAHFATQSRMPQTLRGERAIFPLTWVIGGYAMVYVDHVYNPLAREEYFGYFDAYSLQTSNGVAASSAAIRFLRAHSHHYNLGDRIGALGHSKSSYSVMRVADPNHPSLPEHIAFEGFPEGSPEPQPWHGHSSAIDVAYVSMGLGIRWTQYTTASVVPLVVAVGRHDRFGYWDVTPRQVAKAEALGLNHIALWMAELGHIFPIGIDPATGLDRTRVVRRYFDQILHPHDDTSLRVVAVVPADGAEGVGRKGASPVFGVSDDKLPNSLHGLSPLQPITVRFARSINLASLNDGYLQVIATETGDPVEGHWTASLQNTRFTFEPAGFLEGGATYSIVVNAGIQDEEGRALEESHRQTFRTRPEGH